MKMLDEKIHDIEESMAATPLGPRTGCIRSKSMAARGDVLAHMAPVDVDLLTPHGGYSSVVDLPAAASVTGR